MKKIDNILIGISSAGVVAGLLYLLKKRKREKGQLPPKRAPQLDIKNPGTQDEFLTSASESGIG